jgi:hypothetical protein
MLDLNLGRVLDLYGEVPCNFVCRHESCERLELHGFHELRHKPGIGYRTRSRRHVDQPWRAQNAQVLRASILEAVSIVEPRNFQMILYIVHNDYGSCLERSVYRHLKALREGGAIVRMSWKQIHAYLKPGSKLLSDPGLVYEQILSASRAV